MEQPIWIVAGVIAMIITLGLIASIVHTSTDRNEYPTLERAVRDLSYQCDFSCSMTPESSLSKEVTIPAQTTLYTTRNRICGRIGAKNNKVVCQPCTCELTESKLETNSTLADTFAMLDYKCTFTREDDRVAMGCMG